MGAAGSAGLFGGILSGIGKGLIARRERQDEMKSTALKGALSALASIEHSPNFNPEAVPDLAAASMAAIADYTGTGEKVAKKPGGKKDQSQDPLQHVQQFITQLGQKVYPAGKSTVDTTGQTGKPERKGFFLSDEDRQEAQMRMKKAELEQQEEIRAQYQEKVERQKLQLKRSDDDVRWHDVFDREQKSGRTPDQARQMADEAIYSIRPASAQSTAPRPVFVDIVGPDGKTFQGIEGLNGLTKLGSDVPLDPDKYHKKEKEVKQPKPPAELGGSVRDEVWARKHVNDPDPAVAATAKDVIAKAKKAATTAGAGAGGDSPYKMSDEELRALAERSLITGQDPPFGLSAKNPLRERYQKMKADLIIAEGGSGPSLEKSATFKAEQANLHKLVQVNSAMKASLAGTNLEIDRLKSLAAKVPRSRFAKFNQLEQFLKANLSDDPDLARFREALLAARYRYNSMVSNIRGGGAATNQVRTETADEIIGRFMPNGALDAAADEMKIGLQNIMTGLDQAVTDTQKRIRGSGNKQQEDPLGILK